GAYALRNHIGRLADDHARARRLADAPAPTGVVDAARVRTNIVPLDLTKAALDGPSLGAAARAAGVLVAGLGPRAGRRVAPLDLDDAGVDRAIEALVPILRT